MHGKYEVCLRFQALKTKFLQFFLCPFPGLNDLLDSFLKIPDILDCLDSAGQRRLVHRVRIKGIFRIIEILDQHRIADGISDPHPSHGAGF